MKRSIVVVRQNFSDVEKCHVQSFECKVFSGEYTINSGTPLDQIASSQLLEVIRQELLNLISVLIFEG